MEYFPSHQKLAQIAALSRDAFANLLCVLERMLAFAGPGDHDTHRLTHDESLRALAAAATGQKQHKTNACLDDALCSAFCGGLSICNFAAKAGGRVSRLGTSRFGHWRGN